MENKDIRRITREVEHYFGFLLDRGYTVLQVDYAPDFSDNWIVTLASPHSRVYVGNDRDRITLHLSAAQGPAATRKIPIERLIGTISEGSDIVVPFRNSMSGGKKAQFERLARLLREHLDQVISYFASGSPPIPD
ncbi:MAG: hypothetical protein ACM3MF_09375 [Anaerolineae bacterium]